MERGTIVINKNGVTVTGNVWMADYEIADIFGVTMSVVNRNIKSIYKSGVLNDSDTCRYIHLENGNRADIYNLDMIITLAFRLNSLPAKIFREWIVRKAVTPTHSRTAFVIQVKDGFLC